MKLHTTMIVVAGLALLMTLYPRPVRIESVPPGRFWEAGTVLTVGRELRTRVDQTFDADGVLREEAYLFIPLEFITISVVIAAGLIGFVLCSLWLRSRLREGRDLRVPPRPHSPSAEGIYHHG